ncbi:beta-carboxysome assembly chaperone CcmS [Trichothermofontia sp.]
MTAWETQPPHSPLQKAWVRQLETFVRKQQHALAALNWALYLEQGPDKDTIGIDFEPTPHLVFCRRDAIATLNEQVNNQLREIIGILNGHKPEQEVFILGIGPGQSCEFKLIQFQPDPAPPTCYEQRSRRVSNEEMCSVSGGELLSPAELTAQLEAALQHLV